MTDYAISKKSKRSLWIPILVFITLAACASAGYSYWHSHQVAADDKAQQRVVPSPVFYALDTFTVNLGDADRVLYIGRTSPGFSFKICDRRSEISAKLATSSSCECCTWRQKKARKT